MSSRPTHPPEEQIVIESTALTARTQFFHHCSGSTLPVRDIPCRGKTEPNIEYGAEQGLNNDDEIIAAENYHHSCVPQAIASFLTSDEQFLVLITNPDQMSGGKQIVGYIEKRDYLDMGDRYAVTGPVKLYSFEDAIPVNELGVNPRSEAKLGEAEMETILNHFAGCDEVTEECLEETLRLKDRHSSSPSTVGCGCSSDSDSDENDTGGC